VPTGTSLCVLPLCALLPLRQATPLRHAKHCKACSYQMHVHHMGVQLCICCVCSQVVVLGWLACTCLYVQLLDLTAHGLQALITSAVHSCVAAVACDEYSCNVCMEPLSSSWSNSG
jgi:hypothetical protein